MPTLTKLFGFRFIMSSIIVVCSLIYGCKVDKKNESYNSSLRLADSCYSKYSFRNAINLYQVSEKEVNNNIDSLKIYLKIYQCYDRIDNDLTYQNIDSTFQIIKQLELSNVEKSKELKIEIQLVTAINHYRNGEYRESIRQLFNLNKEKVPDSLRSIINYKIGCCYENLNLLDSGLLFYKKTNDLIKKKNPDKAIVLNSIAYVMHGLYKNKFKIRCYNDSAFSICKSLNFADTSASAYISTHKGMYLVENGNYTSASDYFDRASKLYKTFDDERGNAMVLVEYAPMLAYLSKYDLALSEIEYVTNYYNRINLKSKLIEAYKIKAYILELSKQYQMAIASFQKAYDLAEKVNPSHLSWLNRYIGKCYEAMGDFSKSLEYYKKAESQISPNSIDNILLQGNIAYLLSSQKQIKEAQFRLNKTYLKFKGFLNQKNAYAGYFYNKCALVYSNSGNVEKCILNHQKTLFATVEKVQNVNIYELPKFEYGEINSIVNLLNALVGKAEKLGILAAKSNSLEEKEYFLQKSLEHFEKAREVSETHNKNMVSENDRLQMVSETSSYNEKILKTSLNLYYITGQKKWLNNSFVAADYGKAGVVAMNLKEDALKKLAGLPDSIINHEKDLKEEVALIQNAIRDERTRSVPDSSKIVHLQKQLPQIIAGLNKYSENIENKYPAFKKLKYEGTILNLDSISKNLKSNQLLIQYTMTSDSIYIFMLNNKICHILSVSADSVADRAMNFRNQLTHASENSFRTEGFKEYIDNANWLYIRLFKPIETFAKGCNLTIIPDDVLSLVPFEALVTEKHVLTRPDYGALHYLIKDYTINYTYSAKLFLMQQGLKSPEADGVIAFAPKYNGKMILAQNLTRSAETRMKLLPLPGAEEEANSVTAIYGGVKVLGTQASEERFKSEVAVNNKIVHLAMHTIIDNEWPMYSKLAFYPGKDSSQDGLLNTYEIYNLKLNTPLVVLSACNTGNGKLMKGEGIVGLSRGFYSAGCPSLVITLWSIADKSSNEMMQSFYTHLNKGRNIDYSLRLSKLQHINSSDSRMAHPYYWAGYIQTGKNDAIAKKTTTSWMKWLCIVVSFIIVSISVIYIKKVYFAAVG